MCLLVFGGLYRKPGPTSAWTGFALPRRKGQVVFTWQGIIIAQVGYVAPELPIAGSRAWHQVMRHVPDLGEGCRPQPWQWVYSRSSSTRAVLDTFRPQVTYQASRVI